MQSQTEGPAILFIHGNSSCKEVFANQFADPALAHWRLVAIDLPGHGESEDASDPEATYHFAGYAEMAEQVIEALQLGTPLVFGWSLGGHIGLEMVGRGTPLKGLMISGTPPVKPEPECLMAAFNSDSQASALTGKRNFTDEDVAIYAAHTASADGVVDPHFLAMCRRTDGRAREIMLGSAVAGKVLDERAIVASMAIPLAIVNGADDPFIRPEYLEGLTYGSLWKRGVVRIEGAAHAPFLQRPDVFNRLLAAFLEKAAAPA
ncbi:alpha/beta fold hydrolase [Nitratireductor sp. GCM10026969]|uniref:alpha/beta fold hydrolase n=1 Tax=Nitratireductor sp. GCM10026969 TaxID=3252645 RepID=UPI00360C04D0